MEEKFTGLTMEELDAQQGELLPPRIEMYALTIQQANLNKTVQGAAALNLGSYDGYANAANYNATGQINAVNF